MKLLVLVIAVISIGSINHVFSNELVLEDLEKAYASIYVDKLIEEFDKDLDRRLALKSILLDTDSHLSSYLNSQLYAKILSSRSFIESNIESKHSHKQYTKKLNLLNIQNSELYSAVVGKINRNAEVIYTQRAQLNKQQRKHKKNESVIFPSITTSGNLTGNTYPKSIWSLTYDDGPRGARTKKVVDDLYERGIKATFFMLTREAKRYEETAQYVVDAGMEIALHSYTHKDLNKQSIATMEKEITDAKADLESLLGVDTKVFRLPYGSGMRNKQLRSVITKNKYVHIFWNIDTLDWKDKDPASILRRVKKQMKLTRNGSGIILFHDIHAQSVIASELTMDYLISRGQKICTVSEVINHHNGEKVDCVE